MERHVKMIERMEKDIVLLKKSVSISLCRTDCGIDVLIVGGDQSHIGAVSIADPQGQVCTRAFKGHKDQFISEKWARALYEVCQVPVVVSVGIHYDKIDPAGIKCVVDAMEKQLEEVLGNAV